MTQIKKTPSPPKRFVAGAASGSTITVVKENHVVFAQGDGADAVFNIQKGKIKLTVVSNTGKEAVIAVLGPGDFFGEGCLAGQLLRMSTATAMTEGSILRLEKATVLQRLQNDPAF